MNRLPVGPVKGTMKARIRCPIIRFFTLLTIPGSGTLAGRLE